MKPISRIRIVIIVLVALLAIIYTFPTAQYYLHLTDRPETTGPQPVAESRRPPEADIEGMERWVRENPEVVRWEAENQAYVDWEAEAENLRQSAIPLGLDLLGGADVTLMLNREKWIAAEVSRLLTNVRDLLENNQISAQLTMTENNQAFMIDLANKQDARTAANLINESYEGTIDERIDAEALAQGPVRATISTAVIDDNLRNTIEGAKKAIQERVNALGVTQPRIAVQGNNRIRVQVPGEKNPDRLIRNVIRPADLAFHIVHESMYQGGQLNPRYFGPDARVLPGADLPAGTRVVSGKLAQKDPQSGQIQYNYQDFIILRQAELTGDDLRSANVQIIPSDFRNPIQVAIEFKPDAADRFAQLTEKYAEQQRQLAILLDGVVRSAPTINEPILNGRATITGGFSREEATELSQILKAGSLPAPLKIESKRTVGATLGVDSILSGVKALIWGALMIGIFMILYYRTAGVIALIALTLNVLIILALMGMTQATLTLSGIGGILLTIGMAVDANVLIYERIREEVESGRPLRQAIGSGFNHAFSVILDSNLTTLLTALVLLQFTEGSVFGFALTMTFGLLANLFTGLTVTYTLCALYFQWRGRLALGRDLIFRKIRFDFIKMRKFSWPFSGIVLAGALILVIIGGGLNYNVDFAGGASTEVQFTTEVDEGQIHNALAQVGIQNPYIIPVIDEPNMYIIDATLLEPPVDSDLSAPSYTEARIEQALADNFGGQYEVVSTNTFGAQTSAEFSELAILVVVLASIAILVYLWFRFELAFGVAAVIALIHDLLIVTLLSTLWGVQISLEVVAALMVLLGLSVNDTIVIFDRIRENTRAMLGKSFGEICNLSMNQSLSRTIITSGTTFLVMLILLLVGGEGLRQFAKVLVIGCIVGTYSSDFMAAPLVYQWNKHKQNRLQHALAAKKKKREAAQPIRSAGAATRPTAASR